MTLSEPNKTGEPDWQAMYVEMRRRIERMAREPGRVRTPSELRGLLVYPPGDES